MDRPSSDPTICKSCANLFVVNKTDRPYRYLCMAAKMEPWFNFVIGESIADPPYQYAIKKNFGDCVDYRPGVNSLSPNLLNLDGTPKEGEEK